MAETTLETALVALAAVLTGPPGSAPLQRNTDVPTTVGLTGLLILRDGDPGEPDIVLSPLRYSYEHAAALELYVQSSPSSARAVTLPALLAEAGGRLGAASRTLGGAVEFMLWTAPETDDVPIPGGATIRGAVVTVFLHYTTTNPLT